MVEKCFEVRGIMMCLNLLCYGPIVIFVGALTSPKRLFVAVRSLKLSIKGPCSMLGRLPITGLYARSAGNSTGPMMRAQSDGSECIFTLSGLHGALR